MSEDCNQYLAPRTARKITLVVASIWQHLQSLPRKMWIISKAKCLKEGRLDYLHWADHVFATAERCCFLTAALPNVQCILYTVNKVLACKDDAGRSLCSLAIACQLFQLTKWKKSCLSCCTSLPRRKASILVSIFAQIHLQWFFRSR